MGIVVRFPGRHGHAPSETGYKSGRSSCRETPVSRSIGKTNSAFTPRLERVSQYQTCCCVVPIRSAKGFCPPAISQARLSASVDDMESPYQVLGSFQLKTLSGTENKNFSRLFRMVDLSAKGVGARIKRRRNALGVSQLKLAKTLHIPQQTIGGWETGKARRPRLLLELSKVLCTTQEWLLREEGPEEIAPIVSKAEIGATIESLDPRLVPAALEFLRRLGDRDTEAA